MADPDGMDRPDVNMDALKSEIRRQLINQKVRIMELCRHGFDCFSALHAHCAGTQRARVLPVRLSIKSATKERQCWVETVPILYRWL